MHWPLTRVAVAERSMEPALRPGDWLLVRRTRRVRAGQIVLARHPSQPDLLIVKRVARQTPEGRWWLESDKPDAGAVASPVNTGNIPFWWDILTVAGFSLVIYFWAMRTKLSRQDMLALVNQQGPQGDEPMPDVHH